jgi:penicillin-binding protein 2
VGRIASRKSKQQVWDQLHARWCRDAQDAGNSAYVRAISRENCVDGWRYKAGDAANFAIGQGDTVLTPLQLAMVYAAATNGGTLYKPQLARAVIGPDGKLVKDYKPVVAGKVPVSPEVLDYMRAALAEVPTDGTASSAFRGFEFDKLTVGGKTGTAQVVGKQDTAWFAGFAPSDKPKYVSVVMITQAGTGGSVAAPAVRHILEGIYGLEGRTAALPGGNLPGRLPTMAADGTVVQPPGVRRPAPAVTPTPSSTPSPTAQALGSPLAVRRGRFS